MPPSIQAPERRFDTDAAAFLNEQEIEDRLDFHKSNLPHLEKLHAEVDMAYEETPNAHVANVGRGAIESTLAEGAEAEELQPVAVDLLSPAEQIKFNTNNLLSMRKTKINQPMASVKNPVFAKPFGKIISTSKSKKASRDDFTLAA